LIVDDDLNTSLKYKRWLQEEGFESTLINDPYVAEQNFNPENYDLVLIGFRMSVIDVVLIFTISFLIYQKKYNRIHHQQTIFEYAL
jgi:DNA-binding response OmpR family regulator